MNEELITPENLSIELLKSIFDAALMECRTDDDGNLTVQEQVRVRVKVNQDRKDRVRFLTAFGFKTASQVSERVDCVNKINSEYIMVTASAEEDVLFFRYDLLVTGGVTRKALVMALKRFASIPQGALSEYGTAIVE